VDRRQLLLDYLQRQHVMTIATTSPEGPWAAPVFYANRGLRFYFLSAPTTRHCRDLAASPDVVATIAGDVREWSQVKGVQLRGRARELSGEERDAAQRLYATKFPGVTEARGVPTRIAEAFAKIRWYELQSNWIRFVDNSAGFGHRDEWSAAELDF
jgi:hypothetical protein